MSASVGPVDGGERLREAADLRQDDVGVVVERVEDAPDEAGVQERDVGGRRIGGGRAIAHGGEPGRQTLQRPATLARVLDDLDAVGQCRERLAGRAHDDDRPVDGATDDPGDPPQERRAVPFERGLRRAHPRRAPAGEHDPCGVRPWIRC